MQNTSSVHGSTRPKHRYASLIWLKLQRVRAVVQYASDTLPRCGVRHVLDERVELILLHKVSGVASCNHGTYGNMLVDGNIFAPAIHQTTSIKV
jgi:hypothetical protein